VHVGDGVHDDLVEAAPDVAFPARHGRDAGTNEDFLLTCTVLFMKQYLLK
jgi:hypothetical protein